MFWMLQAALNKRPSFKNQQEIQVDSGRENQRGARRLLVYSTSADVQWAKYQKELSIRSWALFAMGTKSASDLLQIILSWSSGIDHSFSRKIYRLF